MPMTVILYKMGEFALDHEIIHHVRII